MNGWTLDVPTAVRLGSLIYLLMPATVWVALKGRHRHDSLLAWCGGAGAYGLAYSLIGLRGSVPDWLSIEAANLLLFASYPLRIGSLRIEAGQRPGWPAAGVWLAVSAAAFVLADAVSPALRVATSGLVQLLGTVGLAWAAARLWRLAGSRTAAMIALAYGVFAAAIGLTLLNTGLGGWAVALQFNAIAALTMVAGFVAALYGSLGFMGMAIEQAHRAELVRTKQLAIESAQRMAAEQHAVQLREWLGERDELLQLLSHEVRQPLNNATAALQAARSALAPSGIDAPAAGLRVQRAEAVLGHIIGTLDNTLAATALLAGAGRVDRRDADVDTLIALSIGDLDVSFRPRVRIEKEAGTRTATMDAGLMRLALRNLLGNAAAYAPADSAVLLRITDSDAPLALVFEVQDRGPGVDAALAARLFERGARGGHGFAGHGLGLYVVRRVMELHGGSVDQRPNPGGGSIFRLLLPQGVADGGSPLLVHAERSSPRNR